MLSKPQKRKSKRVRPPVADEDMNVSLPEDEVEEEKDARSRKKAEERAEKRKKEKQIILSAQFIEDSDEEIGDDDTFFAAEAALRQRMIAAAEGGVEPTQINGAKKKRKKESDSEANESEDGVQRKRARKNNAPKRPASIRSSTEDISSNEEGTPTLSRSNARSNNSTSSVDKQQAGDMQINERSPTSSPPPASSQAASSDASNDEDSDSKVRSTIRKLKRLSSASSVALDFEDSEPEEDALPAPRPSGTKGRGAKGSRLLLSDEEDD